MELLAPAGSWEAFIAAVENGADAVYLGGQAYSARQSAANFNRDELKAALEYAHLRQRKVYVTVNTLIEQAEFGPALDFIWDLYQLNVDAVIVQDLGLMNAIHSLLPAMRIHASTQMTVHNAAGAELLFQQGVKRIVLAREMQLSEMNSIRQQVVDGEFEVFVHGALCYSFSGQCLFSSMVGGRSGNRGRCAQPCRLPYELKKQGDVRKQGDVLFASCKEAKRTSPCLHGKGPYVLSPADLCLIDLLPQLQATGINSLKIEGRMKRPEYVAVVTRAYREALDLLEDNNYQKVTGEARRRLLKIFNRNFSTGYLFPEQAGFLSSQKPNNRGVYLGRVLQQDKAMKTMIKLSDDLNIGDGLEIWVGKGKNPAFIVKEILLAGSLVQSALSGQVVGLQADGWAAVGDRVFKTHDEELLVSALGSIKENRYNKIALDAEVRLAAGQALELVLSDERGNRVRVWGNTPVQPAENHPLNQAVLENKLGRLGNTAFWLRKVDLKAAGDYMVPISEINEARRQAVEQLLAINLRAYTLPRVDGAVFQASQNEYLQLQPAKKRPQHKHRQAIPRLSIVVSGVTEAYAAARSGADRVYLALEGLGAKAPLRPGEFDELVKYGQHHGCNMVPALPRIQMPGEEDDWEGLFTTSAGRVMVANPGALKWALDRKIRVRGDYSLNIFNPYSLNYLLQLGVEGACLSPELSWSQLSGFAAMDKCEIMVHGEVIVMVSRYCSLRGILGDEASPCPKYCHQGRYSIRDDKDYEFPLASDNYCRFYVFNSRTLCMIDELEKVISLGSESIRIEARRSNENEIGQWVSLYRRALDELASGLKPDLNSYKEELALTSPSPLSKYHYHRGILEK